MAGRRRAWRAFRAARGHPPGIDGWSGCGGSLPSASAATGASLCGSRGDGCACPFPYTQELDDAETKHDNVYDQHDRSDRPDD